MHTCVCLLVQWRSIPHPRSFAAGDSKNWTEFPVLSGCTQVGRGVWTRTEMNQPGWLRTHGQHVLVSPWGGGGHSPRNRSGHPEEIRLCSRVHPPPPRRTESCDLCCHYDSSPDKQKMSTIRKVMFAYHWQNEKKYQGELWLGDNWALGDLFWWWYWFFIWVTSLNS